MERTCSCCAYHSYNHDRYSGHVYASPSAAPPTTQSPSPMWPLAVLCMVFALLMGPMVLEPPEEILSMGQLAAICMLLPFVMLLALHFFQTHPQQEQYTMRPYIANSSAYSSNGYQHSAGAPTEEPLHGWGLFLMFILAVLLLPLTRS